MSRSEVDLVEQSLGLRLPSLYRHLLIQLGPGPIGSSAELYNPSRVPELYAAFFDDRTALLHPYFPFGCHHGKQEMWVIDSTTERAASIWHETVPDDWPDEEWLAYDDWVQRHLVDTNASFSRSTDVKSTPENPPAP